MSIGKAMHTEKIVRARVELKMSKREVHLS